MEIHSPEKLIAMLEQRVQVLEKKTNTEILADKFWKRALTIWGYMVCGYMMIALFVAAFSFTAGLISGLFS